MSETNSERYVIVRGTYSGAFAGVWEAQEGQRVVLRDCRRLYYWSGAASLSEMANRGVKCPEQCKFPDATSRHEILDAIEVIDATPAAMASIARVAPWRA